MTAAADRRFMALALSLGRRGMGRVWPNPAVGCVIVKNGIIVGRGRTADGGRPHAETEALSQAQDAARGATAYVTLEPCAHHGQTPPCAEALVAAGIARVVVACDDPNPQVSGKGYDILRAAGIAVDTGVMQAEAARDHAGFLSTITRKRPFVTLKLATTLDGKIATASGHSQWITGPEARRAVHAMRARHDAVMVGAGTVRADDPQLNVRGFGKVPQPVRVVMSAHLKLPKTGQLFAAESGGPVWLCHGPDADTSGWGDAELISVAAKSGQVDPGAALGALAARGITRVFCEGGGLLAASLLAQGLVDALVVFQGGSVIGAEGRPATGPLGISELPEAPRFTLVDVRPIGADVVQHWLCAD